MTLTAEPITTVPTNGTYVPTEPFIFDRWVARLGWPRRRAVIVIGIILMLIPFVVAYLEEGSGMFALFTVRQSRHLFFFPLMITFLLAVFGPVQRTREDVARALRPLVQVDDGDFAAVVDRACQIKPTNELIAFAAGVVFLLATERMPTGNLEIPVASLYVYVAGMLMFGVIGWAVFAGFSITKLTNALLRLPVKIDIFDTEELAPIGRQSLYLALIFIGAIVLSLVFIVSPSSLQEFLSPQNMIIYGVLIALTVAVFFLNMHRTHSLLAATRTEQPALNDQNLARAYYDLQGAIANGKDTHAVSAEVNALATCKQELKLTRTWPYNTEMLRTLAISILTPLLLGLVRVLAPLFVQ